MTDLTAQKHHDALTAAQAALRDLNASLEGRIVERTRELADANDRLRQERLLSELIVENAAEGIIVVDTEMRHLLWNTAMERITGYRAAPCSAKQSSRRSRS